MVGPLLRYTHVIYFFPFAYLILLPSTDTTPSTSMVCGMVPPSSSLPTLVRYTNPTHTLLMNGILAIVSLVTRGRNSILSISGHIPLIRIPRPFRLRQARQVMCQMATHLLFSTSQYRGRKSGCTEDKEGALLINLTSGIRPDQYQDIHVLAIHYPSPTGRT
jgi:hypothetical protein